MKNEWPYNTCQFSAHVPRTEAGNHPQFALWPDDTSLASGTASTTTYTSATNTSQPRDGGADQPPHTLPHEDYIHCTENQSFYEGELSPRRSPVIKCRCGGIINLPDNRTILHGILTGQGYRYGYCTGPGTQGSLRARIDDPYHPHAITASSYMTLFDCEPEDLSISHHKQH